MAVHEPRVPPATWTPPDWLLPHQPEAARGLASALCVHGVALLADATGLGKTWTALAVATRYDRIVAVVPAILVSQWRRTARQVGVTLTIVTHEALSRGGRIPRAGLLVVDEAHRFRNPTTVRYDRLARGVRQAHVLLVTATPVVNTPGDLHALLRVGLATVPSDLAPLMVVRTVAQAGVAGMPAVVHDRIPRHNAYPDLIAAINTLAFPTFGRLSVDLLRRHLLYRLGSSLAAAAETLRRHDRYLERLMRAPLTRAEFRRLVDPDDPQIEIMFELTEASGPEIARERDRIATLLIALSRYKDGKADAAVTLLGARHGRTVVFTAATATARMLAERLGWRRVALVSGNGARIASGPLPVGRALDCFAPVARGAQVAEAERADLLIATDLASEGLNLQDADAVVHYDLPWTPQRLLQRLGRVARLGSRHARVEVIWFPAPVALDIPARLTRKERVLQQVLVQRRLDPVPEDSRPPLTRPVYRLARRAALDRDEAMLGALDAVLARLRVGIVAGAERELRDILSGDPRISDLERWLGDWPDRAISAYAERGPGGEVSAPRSTPQPPTPTPA